MKRHVAATWEGYRKLCIRRELTPEEETELRSAFFAGAATLFEGMLASMSPGPDETPADLAFMARLQTELQEFGRELDWRVLAIARRREGR